MAVLSFALLCVPLTVLADGGTGVTYLWCDNDGKNFTAKTCTNYALVTAKDTEWTGSGENAGWYVAEGDVTVSERVTVTGNVHLILSDGCTLTLEGGIKLEDDDRDASNGSPNTLTVYSGTEGTGKLVARAKDNIESGIGIDLNTTAAPIGGVLTVNGGTVEAYGTSLPNDTHKTSVGIHADLHIHGGQVLAQAASDGGESTVRISRGIENNSLTVTGGTLTVRSGDLTASSCVSVGILTSDALITGGSVDIQSGTLSGESGTVGGIIAKQTLTVCTSGELTITTKPAEAADSQCIGAFIGILTVNDSAKFTINCSNVAAGNTGIMAGYVNVYGGELTVNSGAGLRSFAIAAVSSMTVEGGTVTATAADTSDTESNSSMSVGITTPSLTISGGAVNASGGDISGTDESNMSSGIFITNEAGEVTPGMTVSGGTLNASGGAASSGVGIYSEPTLKIEGGEVNTYGGEATSEIAVGASVGITAFDIEISGGKVTALGKDAAGASAGIYGQPGGSETNQGDITITGGSVNAQSGETGEGAFLNAGLGTQTGTLTMEGDVVIVTNSLLNSEDQKLEINKGIIFVGNTGMMIGDSVTVTEDITIPEGTEFYVSPGSSIKVEDGVTLTNNGVIYVEGEIIGDVSGNTEEIYYPINIDIIAPAGINVTVTSLGGTREYNGMIFSKGGSSVKLKASGVNGGYTATWQKDSEPKVSGKMVFSFTMPNRAVTIKLTVSKRNPGSIVPTYFITIPATAEMGGTVTITAEGVSMPSGQSLEITLTDADGFKLKNESGDELGFSISKGGVNIDVGDSVLTLGYGDSNGTAELLLSLTDTVRYPGTYTATLTFTVSTKNDP